MMVFDVGNIVSSSSHSSESKQDVPTFYSSKSSHCDSCVDVGPVEQPAEIDENETEQAKVPNRTNPGALQ